MPAATLITAVPTSISPQEHRALVASTPASFNDIPPILRHKEENVSVTLDPPLEGFAASDGAQGTLYVIESVLIFMSTTGRAFQIEYPAITLHAVSRAESGPSIYCQLDEHAGEPNAPSGGDEDTLDDLRELIIVPKRDSALDDIFEALSLCASLHPDEPPASDDEDDDAYLDDSNFDTFTGNEDEELSEVGRAALAHLESIIYDPRDHVDEDEGEDAKAEESKESTGAVNGGEEKEKETSETVETVAATATKS